MQIFLEVQMLLDPLHLLYKPFHPDTLLHISLVGPELTSDQRRLL